MSAPLLDTKLLAERRTAEGLSQRALAKRLGVRSPMIAAMERGDNHADLSLALLVRLAGELGAAPSELFAQPADEREGGSEDDIKLEALLAGADRLMAASEIASALEWDLRRTSRALRSLRSRLRGTGQRLHTGADTLYGLRANTAMLTRAQRQRGARAEVSRTGITRPQAALLRELVAAPIPESAATAGNAKRVNTARLLRLGLAELEDGTLRLSADARFSLGLDERR